MIVGADAPVKCSCGSRDCWEAHASEKAVVSRYQRLLEQRNLSQQTVEIKHLVTLAKSGEAQAIQSLKETAHYLGIGISNLIVGLSPQAVIVSGSIVEAWDLIAGELQSIAERSVRADLPKTILMASSLGDSPTLIGSLSLVLAKKFASAS
jgi:predicted NBD/HSP70 family sugar kinase